MPLKFPFCFLNPSLSLRPLWLQDHLQCLKNQLSEEIVECWRDTSSSTRIFGSFYLMCDKRTLRCSFSSQLWWKWLDYLLFERNRRCIELRIEIRRIFRTKINETYTPNSIREFRSCYEVASHIDLKLYPWNTKFLCPHFFIPPWPIGF